MRKVIVFSFLLVILAAPVFSQSTGKKIVKHELSMAESGDLTKPSICGAEDEIPPIETFNGIVKKRDFADDEINLIGFVMADRKDLRSYINIDSEYVSTSGHWTPDDLSRILVVGNQVRIQTYRCRRILYLKSIKLIGSK